MPLVDAMPSSSLTRFDLGLTLLKNIWNFRHVDNRKSTKFMSMIILVRRIGVDNDRPSFLVFMVRDIPK